MRLIDAAALIKAMERTQSFLKPEIYQKVIKGIVINNAIEKAPTINPESLRPHVRQNWPKGEQKMLNELAKEIHENAVAHGWWEEERTFGEIAALCHSELSEALEEYRNKEQNFYCGLCHYTRTKTNGTDACLSCYTSALDDKHLMGKPEGIATEMADCIIRILDWCGHESIDIDQIVKIKMEYNKTRPYRHGGKQL